MSILCITFAQNDFVMNTTSEDSPNELTIASYMEAVVHQKRLASGMDDSNYVDLSNIDVMTKTILH